MIEIALLLLMGAQAAPPPTQRQKPETKHESVASTASLAFMAKRIIGTWEQPPQGDASTGVTLTLAPDGTATVSSGIMEDLNYNFDGTRLIVVDADDPEDVKQVSTVTLNGDSMKETNDESAQSAEFVRVPASEKEAKPSVDAKDAASKIVGEWKRDIEHLPMASGLNDAEKAKRLEIAQNGRYYYKPDGRLYVRIPLSQQNGKWDLASDGTMRLEFGGKAQESKVSFDSDNEDLVLTRSNGREVYHKAER